VIATTSGDNRGSFRLRLSPDQNPRLKPFDGHSDDSLRTTWDPGQPLRRRPPPIRHPQPLIIRLRRATPRRTKIKKTFLISSAVSAFFPRAMRAARLARATPPVIRRTTMRPTHREARQFAEHRPPVARTIHRAHRPPYSPLLAARLHPPAPHGATPRHNPSRRRKTNPPKMSRNVPIPPPAQNEPATPRNFPPPATSYS